MMEDINIDFYLYYNENFDRLFDKFHLDVNIYHFVIDIELKRKQNLLFFLVKKYFNHHTTICISFRSITNTTFCSITILITDK